MTVVEGAPVRRETTSAADARRMLVGVAAVTRVRRADLRVTQEELGRRCGFGRHYLGSIERAEATLDLRRIARLACALGYEDLLDLLTHASIRAAQLQAAVRGPEGGGSNGHIMALDSRRLMTSASAGGWDESTSRRPSR